MSKSESIRQFFSKHPYATNQEVVDGLSKDGVVVNANLINQVRHDYKHKKISQPVLVSNEEPLLKLKALADEVGGVDRLIQLAFLLKRLIGEDKNDRESGFDGQANSSAEVGT